MSRFASLKTAQILTERIAQCERSNAPVAQFCQSIKCSPMFSPSGVVQGDLWDHQKRPQPKACCGDLRAKAKQPGAGLRRDETVKLPDDFGPIISRHKVITQQATEFCDSSYNHDAMADC
jgi:hypothetical protein